MAADPITAVATVVADSLELVKQKDAQENTPAVQQGAESVQDQKEKDAIAKAVADEDVEQIRKNLAT